MTIFYKQFVVLIPAVILIAACAPASTPAPTLLRDPVPPTPTVTVAVPTSPPPTAMPPTEISTERSERMKIKITFDDTVITATLIDSKTVQDFVSLLPLTLTLEDYGSTEKIGYLPRRLSTEDAPSGIDPLVGDIAYYAPWGNMAIFIRDFGYSDGLVLLGKFDGDMEALNVSGPVSVTIELIQ